MTVPHSVRGLSVSQVGLVAGAGLRELTGRYLPAATGTAVIPTKKKK
jgi:hypothetical protein